MLIPGESEGQVNLFPLKGIHMSSLCLGEAIDHALCAGFESLSGLISFLHRMTGVEGSDIFGLVHDSHPAGS